MYDGIKVFTATKHQERQSLGDNATAWVTEQAGRIEIVDTRVTQSSDNDHHCLTITIFYKNR